MNRQYYWHYGKDRSCGLDTEQIKQQTRIKPQTEPEPKTAPQPKIKTESVKSISETNRILITSRLGYFD